MNMLNFDAGIQTELEQLRKKCKRAKPIRNVCVLLGIAGLLVVFALFGLGRIDKVMAVLICFPGFFIIMLVYMVLPSEEKARMKYARAYKQRIAEPVLRSCLDTVRYSPEQGFPKKEFIDIGVMAVAHTMKSYRSEDFIEGEYEGVAFRQSDVKIKFEDIPVVVPVQYDAVNKKYVSAPKPQNAENHNYTHQLIELNGRLTQFRYQKPIQGKIRIVSKAFKWQSGTEDIPLVLGDSDNFMAAGSYTGGMSSNAMEDVEFNKRFKVYATDSHSVFYLLTPPVMEYLKQLYEVDRQLVISFDGESLYIYRSEKGGIFEPPIHYPVRVSLEAEKCQNEVEEILKCIKALRLDEMQEREKELDAALQTEA